MVYEKGIYRGKNKQTKNNPTLIGKNTIFSISQKPIFPHQVYFK